MIQASHRIKDLFQTERVPLRQSTVVRAETRLWYDSLDTIAFRWCERMRPVIAETTQYTWA